MISLDMGINLIKNGHYLCIYYDEWAYQKHRGVVYFVYIPRCPTSAAKVKVTVLSQQGGVLNKVRRQLIRKWHN